MEQFFFKKKGKRGEQQKPARLALYLIVYSSKLLSWLVTNRTLEFPRVIFFFFKKSEIKKKDVLLRVR